jgi:hypothetical protein
VSTTSRLLRTLAVVGVTGTVAGGGAFSAFTSQADSDVNRVAAGTVTLTDNDAGGALYQLDGATPGAASTPRCIRVSYTGSLGANVRLYTPSTVGATIAPHVNLLVEAGTQASPSFPSCTGFTAQRTVFTAALSTFPTTYAGGVADLPDGQTAWTNPSSVVYRVTASLSSSAPDSVQGESTGDHTLRWEARNQ